MISQAFALLLLNPPADLPAEGHEGWRMATPIYRQAIERAYRAGPIHKEPWWFAEMFRICARESRCGQYGDLGAHGNDYRAKGASDTMASLHAWKHEIGRGRLDPEICQNHKYAPLQWGIRGPFGINAARAVALLEMQDWKGEGSTRGDGISMLDAAFFGYEGAKCYGYRDIDDPWISARVVVQMFAKCHADNSLEPCTCTDHTKIWVGHGTWHYRDLWARVASVNKQCGAVEALRMFGSTFVAEFDWPSWSEVQAMF